MRLSLPKPSHGWREVVGEVGIIVVGVLIALGAEQVVEAIHWRSVLATERASLLQEGRDSLEAVAARARQQGCVDRRLSDIRELLERHHRGLGVDIVAPLGQPTRFSATRGTWQIALAGQALAHMPHGEKLRFSDAFGWFDVWDRILQQESAIWLRIAPLNTPTLLSEENWSDLIGAYSEAVVVNDRLRKLAPIVLAKGPPGIRKYRPQDNFSSAEAMTDQICRRAIRAVNGPVM
jgi:hypothetical protein